MAGSGNFAPEITELVAITMTLNKIRYFESDKSHHAAVCYELTADELPLEKSKELETLVENSHILECQSEHRGPATGEHEASIVVEATDGLHEATACDVTLGTDQENLASFIKKQGHRVETTSGSFIPLKPEVIFQR
jgi:hypothetical protein